MSVKILDQEVISDQREILNVSQATFTGSVTSTFFEGDGSQLSNLPYGSLPVGSVFYVHPLYVKKQNELFVEGNPIDLTPYPSLKAKLGNATTFTPPLLSDTTKKVVIVVS